MADEIQLASSLSVRNGNLNVNTNVSVNADQTTPGGVVRQQSIPTSDTVVTLTGVTTPRMILIENKDATNFVSIGPTSAGAIVKLIRLEPGENCVFPVEPAAVIRAQADTASVVIQSTILET